MIICIDLSCQSGMISYPLVLCIDSLLSSSQQSLLASLLDLIRNLNKEKVTLRKYEMRKKTKDNLYFKKFTFCEFNY